MEKIVIYTAIAGAGHDILRDPDPIPGVDYVCFTDQPFKSNVWGIRKFDYLDDNSIIMAKRPKILPHCYFREYDISIWVDGNILPNRNIVQQCIDYLSRYNMAVHKHPRRGCLYDEVKRVEEVGKGERAILTEQRAAYECEGMPRHFGLWECGVLFRRHNVPELVSFANRWWSEIITRQQPRDQISFAYLLWETGLRIFSIDGNLRHQPYLNYVKHLDEPGRQKQRRIIWRIPNNVRLSMK